MVTVADTRDNANSTAEAVKIAQDAARRFMDESAAIGRTFFTSWGAATQASIRTAWDLQNAMIQGSRIVVDAACQANRNWFDQAADSIHKSQDATSRILSAGYDMADSLVPRPRM